MYAYNLPARLIGVPDTFRNLRSRIKGWGSEQADLPAFVRTLHWRLLGGIVRATYLANISAYLFPVLPKYLQGIIHAWDVAYLQGILLGADYPWNLTASINPSGYWDKFIGTKALVKLSANFLVPMI